MNQTDHLVFPAYSFLEAGLILVCRLLNTHLLWEAVPPALHCPRSLPTSPILSSPPDFEEEGEKRAEATVLSVCFLCCTCYFLDSAFLPGTLVFQRRLLTCTVYSLQPHTRTHTHTFKADQFSSVQLLSHVQLFVTPWTPTRQASLSITNSWSLLKLMSIALVMPSNHLILCHFLLLLPSIFS